MHDAVAQRFLRDAKEAHRDIGMHVADAPGAREPHQDLVPLCDFVAMRSQRGLETEQAQHLRMEVVRQAANLLERLVHLAIEVFE